MMAKGIPTFALALLAVVLILPLGWDLFAQYQERGKFMDSQVEVATLGGGCFWCTEAVFDSLIGVSKVESGYSGGSIPNPTYEQVSSGTTGHAEVVQVTFDPRTITYAEILEIFFHAHDPTTLNRQGADKGTQYRSVIYYHSDSQRDTAQSVIKKITDDKLWDGPIITEVAPFSKFYSAEQYHQDYYSNNKEQPYCSIVIAPKLQKIYREFGGRMKR